MSLLLLVPVVVGLWLVTGGRALDVARARVVAAAAAGVTMVLAVVVIAALGSAKVCGRPSIRISPPSG